VYHLESAYTYWCCSLERMNAYIDIEQEEKPTKRGIPPAYWPASGDLRVEQLSARYSLVRELLRRYSPPPSDLMSSYQDGPKVLHDISFHIKSGERVGVGECS
jgi:ABC-type multidrug transport system fused ATPase/permease subunit